MDRSEDTFLVNSRNLDLGVRQTQVCPWPAQRAL